MAICGSEMRFLLSFDLASAVSLADIAKRCHLQETIALRWLLFRVFPLGQGFPGAYCGFRLVVTLWNVWMVLIVG